MKILELFAGTRSIGKAFEEHCHQVYSVEWDKQFEDIDLYTDIEFLTKETIISQFGIPDVIWASPDCTTYSVAGISHHRINNGIFHYYPISEYAKKSDRVNDNLWKLINEFLIINPKLIYFVENPRGVYRKMYFSDPYPRYTVTYCQYGDNRMKPTDIFTNHPNPNFKPPCKNGDSCHVSSPRGSRNGTQGLKTVDRSKIPKLLCKHIVNIMEGLENEI